MSPLAVAVITRRTMRSPRGRHCFPACIGCVITSNKSFGSSLELSMRALRGSGSIKLQPTDPSGNMRRCPSSKTGLPLSVSEVSNLQTSLRPVSLGSWSCNSPSSSIFKKKKKTDLLSHLLKPFIRSQRTVYSPARRGKRPLADRASSTPLIVLRHHGHHCRYRARPHTLPLTFPRCYRPQGELDLCRALWNFSSCCHPDRTVLRHPLPHRWRHLYFCCAGSPLRDREQRPPLVVRYLPNSLFFLPRARN